MKHYLYKKYRREIMQHGYRKSNYCKRIIRRFVVKCGQIKKPPCESKWKIPVKLRDSYYLKVVRQRQKVFLTTAGIYFESFRQLF